MTEHDIIAKFMTSPRNLASRTEAVHGIRHCIMNSMVFNSTDNEQYFVHYQLVMQFIESKYPLLSWEVKRQMAKKMRWQEKRINESRQVSVHI